MKLKLQFEQLLTSEIDESISERDDVKVIGSDEALERILKFLSPDDLMNNSERSQASNRLSCLHSDVLPHAQRDNT